MCFLFDDKSNQVENTLYILLHLYSYRIQKLGILTNEKIANTVWNMPTASWFIVLAVLLKNIESSDQWKNK